MDADSRNFPQQRRTSGDSKSEMSGSGSGSGSGRMRGGNLRNPCLTMHQPWASLLVCGIKRVEGRSWPAPIRVRWMSRAWIVDELLTREGIAILATDAWEETKKAARMTSYQEGDEGFLLWYLMHDRIALELDHRRLQYAFDTALDWTCAVLDRLTVIPGIVCYKLSKCPDVVVVPSNLRRLWIHAAGKVPDQHTVKAMEDFYREIYALNGITDVKFPENYPVSRLIGCVEVVGCVKCEELLCWEEVPVGARFEGQTDFCWLCEQPQKLVVPFEMRGYQGVYNLERKIYEAAVRGLSPMQSPFPVKFPLPDPSDRFSLKPGSLKLRSSASKASEGDKSASLSEAIDGARSAATQFSKQPGKNAAKWGANFIRDRDGQDTAETSKSKDNGALEEYEGQSDQVNDRSQRGDRVHQYVEQNGEFDAEQTSGRCRGRFGRNISQQPGASSKSKDNGAIEEYERQSGFMDDRLQRRDGVHQYVEQNGEVDIERSSGRRSGRVGRNISQQPGPSSKIFIGGDNLTKECVDYRLPVFHLLIKLAL
ncbi:hypothetical protein ACLOJK_015931 [Asimina triloba]